MFVRLFTFVWLALCAASYSYSAEPVRAFLSKADGWFHGDEGLRVTRNVLSFQSAEGSWPKNTNTAQAPFTGHRSDLHGTFDNGATTDELRFLARAVRATGDSNLAQAFLKGYDHIIRAQYPGGGWPQFYPPPRSYHRHITFNDGAMVRLMEFLREASTNSLYQFIGQERRSQAEKAFNSGIQCILKCQIRVNGKLTAWCAQHDEADYSPRPARTFELASISGAESVGIVRLLMSLEHPEPDVVRAVDAAVTWFESAKLTGIKVLKENAPQSPKGWNKVVVQDPNAAPIWARFYEIKTNKPLFADRDGIARYSLSEVGYERRNGYAWLGDWPASLLERDYPAWKRKHRP